MQGDLISSPMHKDQASEIFQHQAYGMFCNFTRQAKIRQLHVCNEMYGHITGVIINCIRTVLKRTLTACF